MRKRGMKIEKEGLVKKQRKVERRREGKREHERASKD